MLLASIPAKLGQSVRSSIQFQVVNIWVGNDSYVEPGPEIPLDQEEQRNPSPLSIVLVVRGAPVEQLTGLLVLQGVNRLAVVLRLGSPHAAKGSTRRDRARIDKASFFLHSLE